MDSNEEGGGTWAHAVFTKKTKMVRGRPRSRRTAGKRGKNADDAEREANKRARQEEMSEGGGSDGEEMEDGTSAGAEEAVEQGEIEDSMEDTGKPDQAHETVVENSVSDLSSTMSKAKSEEEHMLATLSMNGTIITMQFLKTKSQAATRTVVWPMLKFTNSRQNRKGMRYKLAAHFKLDKKTGPVEWKRFKALWESDLEKVCRKTINNRRSEANQKIKRQFLSKVT